MTIRNDEARPEQMPDRALDLAIRACADSKHPSDREFAYHCERELRRRHGNEGADEVRMGRIGALRRQAARSAA